MTEDGDNVTLEARRTPKVTLSPSSVTKHSWPHCAMRGGCEADWIEGFGGCQAFRALGSSPRHNIVPTSDPRVALRQIPQLFFPVNLAFEEKVATVGFHCFAGDDQL